MPSDVESVLSGYIQAVLDALKDGVYISDRDGKTVCVNRAYEQLTGLRSEDLVGRSVQELIQRGVFDIALNPRIVRTGEPAEHVQHLKDGTILVLSGCPVFDEAGEIRFVVTFARDVSRLMSLTEQIDQQRILMNQTAGQIAYVARQQEKKSHTPTFASPQMAGVLSMVNRIAPTDATVLILGETGVGKDVVARLVHSRSPRHEKLMLKVDCGGISETLTESEIFGYVGGAFTGASSKGKAGYFEIANESTVFLDEIGELPLSMQTRL
ncbi:MAG: sigma 54-interacting transcriptional regulator, partial [Desulfovibrio sp.]|nr:sigma 54-interacting transcriptional regulator [Desulfovibrio sp.]